MKTDLVNRWAAHCKETINRPDPEEDAVVGNTGFQTEMKRGDIIQQEMREAIRQIAGHRAPGQDRITADMLRQTPQQAQRLRKNISTKYGKRKRCLKHGRKASSLNYVRQATCPRVATGEASISLVEFCYSESNY